MAIKKLREYYTTKAYLLCQKLFGPSRLAAITMIHWPATLKLIKHENWWPRNIISQHSGTTSMFTSSTVMYVWH